MSRKNGRILGFISIKGGVGKTTSVINLAASLSNDYEKKVVVVDANFSSPNVSLHLGSVDHKKDLHQVLSDKIHVGEALYESDFGFHFVPSSFSTTKTNFMKLNDSVKVLKKFYDFVLIDSSPSLNDELVAAMVASDELYAVTTPDIPTLSTTLRAIKLAKNKGTQIKGLILNNVRNKKYELKTKDIEKVCGVPVIGLLKHSLKVSESMHDVKPVVISSPYSEVSLGFKKLASYFCGEAFNKPRKLRLLLSRFKDDYGSFVRHDFSKSLVYYK